MAETQTITYGKPPFIEKAQQDLINALNQYIADVPALPEKQITGLSTTQQEAIDKLKSGLGAYSGAFPIALEKALQGTTDYLTPGADYLKQAAEMKFDPTMADPYFNQYQKYVIDEINKQADLAKTKAASEATLRGAYGGSRADVVDTELEKARLSSIGQAQSSALDKALKLALGSFGTEQKAKQVAGQLAPYYTSAATKEQSSLIKDILTPAVQGQQYDLQGISALLGAGGLEQAAIKEAGDVEYQNILAAQNRPLQLYGAFSDIISGLPSQQGYQIQQTYGSTSSPFQDILGAGAAILGGGSAIFSKDGGDLNKGIMALKHG
jgi:hypothetical protein